MPPQSTVENLDQASQASAASLSVPEGADAQVSGLDGAASLKEGAKRPISRWPWLTWGLIAWTVALLVLQWQPLLPTLITLAQQPGEWPTPLAALCLTVPDTPPVWTWQMVRALLLPQPEHISWASACCFEHHISRVDATSAHHTTERDGSMSCGKITKDS